MKRLTLILALAVAITGCAAKSQTRQVSFETRPVSPEEKAEQQKIDKALAIMENNGLMSHAEVVRLQRYARHQK